MKIERSAEPEVQGVKVIARPCTLNPEPRTFNEVRRRGGSALCYRGEVMQVRGFPVDVADTTGAGGVFL